jgi:hypothetical protein
MAPKPSDCREHAKRCVEMATETTDVDLKTSLLMTAQKWERLACDLAQASDREATWDRLKR